MERRYQVFLSSTYEDLRKERQGVIEALLEMDCIPSGMELFPATDEAQFEFIKKVIDSCDYYVLIIGGRYGSVTDEGVSYTEKEYLYAIEKEIPVCAFLHSNPDEIPSGKTEKEIKLSEKLKQFKARVQKGRMVKFYSNSDELPGKVVLSLNRAIKRFPKPGWVKGDQVASIEVYQELEALRKEQKSNTNGKSGIRNQLQHPLDLEFSPVIKGERNQSKTIATTISDLIKAIPTAMTKSSFSAHQLAQKIAEHYLGFHDAMEYDLTTASIDDLVFVLRNLNLLREDSYETGMYVASAKFERAKMELNFGIIH